jgi:hypothetical protein
VGGWVGGCERGGFAFGFFLIVLSEEGENHLVQLSDLQFPPSLQLNRPLLLRIPSASGAPERVCVVSVKSIIAFEVDSKYRLQQTGLIPINLTAPLPYNLESWTVWQTAADGTQCAVTFAGWITVHYLALLVVDITPAKQAVGTLSVGASFRVDVCDVTAVQSLHGPEAQFYHSSHAIPTQSPSNNAASASTRSIAADSDSKSPAPFSDSTRLCDADLVLGDTHGALHFVRLQPKPHVLRTVTKPAVPPALLAPGSPPPPWPAARSAASDIRAIAKLDGARLLVAYHDRMMCVFDVCAERFVAEWRAKSHATACTAIWD